MRDLFWFQALLGGAKAQYETTYRPDRAPRNPLSFRTR
jgi:hypothetical protein